MPRPFGHGLYVLLQRYACTAVLLRELGDGYEMRKAVKEVPTALAPPLAISSSEACKRSVYPRRFPMLLERLTAWTLVIVYYTVTCGAIVLGLRGAL
jgi:hypothetical protein